MPAASQQSSSVIPAKDRLIVALDVPTTDAAARIVDELGGNVGAYKIGLQLFVAGGPTFVEKMVGEGHRIFLDLKFHDIPNTVAKASVEAARLGVWMFNLHALGGGEMMRTAVREVAEFCAAQGIERPKMIAVTMLTSSIDETLSEIGQSGGISATVLRLAKLSMECGLDGVVASAKEAEILRSGALGDDALIVTPGIRSDGATFGDQKRVMTPGGAFSVGASYIVVGRPILEAEDRLKTVHSIVSEIAQVYIR